MHTDFIGGFNQVVAKVAIAGLDQMGLIRIEIAGLMTGPGEAGVLGQSSLILEAGDIADFGEDTRGDSCAAG